MDYFQKVYLEKHQNASKICHILNKLGIENFSLTILELVDVKCDDKDDYKILCEREQYYINLLKPLYNIRIKVYNPTKNGKRKRKKDFTEKD